ncbi:hypothetical protein GCM10009608_29990 [Pseudonocardia alaniniphila]
MGALLDQVDEDVSHCDVTAVPAQRGDDPAQLADLLGDAVGDKEVLLAHHVPSTFCLSWLYQALFVTSNNLLGPSMRGRIEIGKSISGLLP